MRLITNHGTLDGAQPGDEVEVPDNEAPGLIAQGYMKPLSEKGSKATAEPAVESTTSTKKGASEMDARQNEDLNVRADTEG